MHRKVTREWLIERLEEDYTCKRAAKERKIARRHFLCVLHKGVTDSFFFYKIEKQVQKTACDRNNQSYNMPMYLTTTKKTVLTS